MNRQTRFLLALLLLPLVVLAAFLRYQAGQRRFEDMKRRMEHDRISGMREDRIDRQGDIA
jgi:hypothetical protein